VIGTCSPKGTTFAASDAAGETGMPPGSCGVPPSMIGRLLLPLKADSENS
jgi:hypothetical protein